MNPTKLLSISTVLLLAAGPAWPELTRIGGAAAVRGSVNAVSEGQAVGHVIESGRPLFLNDHVTTKTDSRLQVLLLDETVFTMGPDSDMVLDEFVYDPSSSSGKVAARLTKGVFRFVTGKVAANKPSDMKVKVPTGTIGIRGTIVAVEVKPESSLVILAGPGKNNTGNATAGRLALSSGVGKEQLVTKNGFGAPITKDTPVPTPTDHSADLVRLESLVLPKGGSNSTPPGGGGGKKSATKQTGSDALSSLGGLVSGSALAQQTDDSQQLAANTSQQGSGYQDGTTNWDFIRSQIQSGQGYYFSGEAGGITCSGCTSSAPEASLQLEINFGAQTVGGQGLTNPVSGQSVSFIHLHGVTTSNNTDQQQQNISQMSFASLTGPAVIQLTNSNLGSLSGGATGSFAGSSINLQNANGQVASQALTNLQFSGSTSSSSGSPVSASGQFVSPLIH